MKNKLKPPPWADTQHWNLLLADRVTSLAPPEQFAAYAIAYLDSAERLCRVLAISHRKATYERGSVVLYLTTHAVELFLKGAILRKKPHERFGHNLEYLYNRYKELYPAKRHHFDMPFRANYDGLSKDEIKAIKAASAPVDQLYRYPQNKNGEPWFGHFAFEANSFLIELGALRLKFDRILHHG